MTFQYFRSPLSSIQQRMGLCNDKEAVARSKANQGEDITRTKQVQEIMEEQQGQEIILQPSTDIKPKTLSTTPTNCRSQIITQKNNNDGNRPPPCFGGNAHSNKVEDSLGYMGQYTYVHKVLPPSGLQTSARMAKLQDPKSLHIFANPHLFIEGSENRNGNQTYPAGLDQINQEYPRLS